MSLEMEDGARPHDQVRVGLGCVPVRLPILISSSSVGRIAGIISVTLCLVACGNKLRESTYHTLADARQDRAIERGWIPDYLPQSSRDIHEIHRIEHSKTWCMFEFLQSDSESLRRTLKAAEKSRLTDMRIESPGASWWPSEFDGNLDVKSINREGYELLAFEESASAYKPSIYLFMIDWSSGRAYFYQTTRRDRIG